jgi:hypothetical protein
VALGKKLKKKIKELAGLDGVSLEDRIKRAKYILNSNEEKQKLCSNMLGLTYKQIDTVMRSVLAEKRMSEDELEEIENPEKFSHEKDYSYYHGTKSKITFKTLNSREVHDLIRASQEPIVKDEVIPTSKKAHREYTLEEVNDLINGTYNFTKYKHLNKKYQ